MMINKVLLFMVIAVMMLAGCSGSSEPAISTSSVKSIGKDAWNAFSFANNIANPMYYGQKAATKMYDSYKEGKGQK